MQDLQQHGASATLTFLPSYIDLRKIVSGPFPTSVLAACELQADDCCRVAISTGSFFIVTYDLCVLGGWSEFHWC